MVLTSLQHACRSLFTIVQNVLSGIVSIVLGYHPAQSIHALVSMYMHLHKVRFQAYVTLSVLT